MFCETKHFYNQFFNLINKEKNQGKQIFDAILKVSSGLKINGLNKEPVDGNSGYWSYRINNDMRIITLERKDEIIFCFLGHHKEAYRFCTTTKPAYCANNLIGLMYVEQKEEKTTNTTYNYLSDYKFDDDVIDQLNSCKSQKEVDSMIRYFAPEHRELILSKGEKRNIIKGYSSEVLVMSDDEDLEKALSFELPEWCVFLHPKQISIRDFDFNKNLLVKGGPGTGKTVTMVWRYVNLYHHIEDKKPVFLCRSVTTAMIVKDMIKQIDPTIKPLIEQFPISETYAEMNSFFSKFSHIVIDEGQDLGNYSLRYLYKKVNNKDSEFPPISIALDFNQPILNLESRKLIGKFENYFNIEVLDYSYRCTKEILDTATKVLTKYDECDLPGKADNVTKDMDCPLCGNPVKTKVLFEDNEVPLIVENIVKEKNLLLDDNVWCIIFSGFFNDALFEDMDNKYKGHVYDSEQCKGREFFFGFVLHYCNEEKPTTVLECKKEKFEPYVSLTRFRDSCIFIQIKKRYHNERNLMNAQDFISSDLEAQVYKCTKCKREFSGVPAHTTKSTKLVDGHEVPISYRYCKSCWYETKMYLKGGTHFSYIKRKNKSKKSKKK